LHHLHHQLALTFCHSYGAFGETGRNRLGSEVRAPLAFLCFKISKPSDSFAGDVDPYVLGCSVGVANKGRDATRVEDAIKITTCRLGSIGELVPRGFDLRAGIVRLLQSLGCLEGLLE
jgi:hypothetical protein